MLYQGCSKSGSILHTLYSERTPEGTSKVRFAHDPEHVEVSLSLSLCRYLYRQSGWRLSSKALASMAVPHSFDFGYDLAEGRRDTIGCAA